VTQAPNQLLQNRARTMRTNQTPAERRMWAMLGGSRLEGLKFRRQAVIDQYIVDFLCPALALGGEVDGASHTDPERDAQRDAYLASKGYLVMRFANWQVMEQGDMVALAILAQAAQMTARWENGPRNSYLRDVPTTDPSPEPKASAAQREGS